MANALAITKAAWMADRARPKMQRHRHELEFLPAAVEVVETPASPAGRTLLWVIIALCVIALGWSWIGVVDVVAIADGKVVSTGRSKVVQPLEAGIVRAIRVADGTRVKAGDVLVELDLTSTNADREHVTGDLMNARVEEARLRAALGDEPMLRFDPPAASAPAVVATQRALLGSQVTEHRARIAGLDGEIARRRADRTGIEATVVKFERTVPMVRQRADARATLAARGYAPRMQAVELQQQLVEQQQELAVTRAKLVENDAAIEALERQRQQAVAEYEKANLAQLTDVEKRIANLAQELLKAEQRRDQQTLMAPIDGVVQQLAVHTVGGVVTPAQSLMVIAPKDDSLEVEALILNRDIGFVEPGQETAIKLETFLFTKYGTVPGRVISVSGDAVQHEKLGLVYPARIALEKTVIDAGGKLTSLAAGMAVTAEIKTDTRRVIDYLLSPILRYRQESLRER